MLKIVTFLNRYFFASANLLTIGILRIILVFLAARSILRKNIAPFKDSMLTELHERSFLTDLLGDNIFLEWSPTFLTVIIIATAVGSLIGFLTRISLFVFGLLTIYLTGFQTSMGMFDHSSSLISQIILILAFIPGSTNLSIDRIIKWLFKYKKGLKPTIPDLFFRHQDPVWGVRLLLMLLACVYFTAGVSKLRYGGLKWLDGKTLSHYLDGSANPKRGDFAPPIFLSDSKVSLEEKWKDGFGLYSYSYGNRQSSPTALKSGRLMAESSYLIMSLSILTVMFELCSFFLLIDKSPRTLYLLGAIIMHTSIGFFMGLTFIQFRIICFLLIDWQWLVKRLSSVKIRLNILKNTSTQA